MKKKALIVLVVALTPLLMAIQCEDDNPCGLSDFEGYILDAENPQLTYAVNDTIWFSSSASSRLIDYCVDVEQEVVVFDNQVFRESFFPVQLKTSNETNAVISLNDFDYIIDNGSAYNLSFCHESYYVLPTLSNTQNEYEFRVGLIPKTQGDFAIATGFAAPYRNGIDLNLDVYEPYSDFDNQLKFDICGDTYTRYNSDRNNFFFRVE